MVGDCLVAIDRAEERDYGGLVGGDAVEIKHIRWCHVGCDVEKFDDILAKPDPISDFPTVLLTKKMIALGISVYTADPIAEIKRALQHTRRGRPPR